MEITYGHGEFLSEQTKVAGRIILGEHKLFIRNGAEDLAATFIPLEKIERLKLKSSTITLTVRPAIMSKYQVTLSADANNIKELAHELVQRRGLKKRFMQKEWFDQTV